MSVRAISKVFDDSIHSGTHLLLLIALADFSDDEGNSYPAMATLARKCRTTPRNANRLVAALRDSGELEIRLGEGPKGTNRYRIRLDQLGRSSSGTPDKGVTPDKRVTLTPKSAPPDTGVLNPLTPVSDKPSLNRQEPSERAHRSTKRSKQTIPENWKPDAALMAWVKTERPELAGDIDQIVKAFRSYWLAKGTARADWTASFKEWVRRERSPTPKRAMRHAGFDGLDFAKGVRPDGSLDD